MTFKLNAALMMQALVAAVAKPEESEMGNRPKNIGFETGIATYDWLDYKKPGLVVESKEWKGTKPKPMTAEKKRNRRKMAKRSRKLNRK